MLSVIVIFVLSKGMYIISVVFLSLPFSSLILIATLCNEDVETDLSIYHHQSSRSVQRLSNGEADTKLTDQL